MTFQQYKETNENRGALVMQFHTEKINRKLPMGTVTQQQIFVFGSNRMGWHGAGAAREAVEKYGAVYGQPDGRQGNSYAIVTTELRPDEDQVQVSEAQRNILRFINYAKRHPELQFYVTPVGTGLAGFNKRDILPLFENEAPNNCILTWKDARYAYLTK